MSHPRPLRPVSKRSVTLTIAGQTLSIRTDAPDARLRTVTARVDARVAEIRRGAPTIPTAKVHLLAALTLAEELVSAEETANQALAEAASAAARTTAPDPAVARALEQERAARRAAHRQLDLLARSAEDELDEAAELLAACEEPG